MKALGEVDFLLIGCVLLFFFVFDGACGGGFLINWLCSVVFLFVVLTYMKIEGAGGGGFLINWLCSVVFLFVVLTYMKIED